MHIMLMYWKSKLMETDNNCLCNCSYDAIDRNQVDCFSVFVCMYVYVSANAWLRIAFLYDFCIYDNGSNDEHLTRTVMCSQIYSFPYSSFYHSSIKKTSCSAYTFHENFIHNFIRAEILRILLGKIFHKQVLVGMPNFITIIINLNNFLGL